MGKYGPATGRMDEPGEFGGQREGVHGFDVEDGGDVG